MDLHRRKLWGDRAVWLLVVTATAFIVGQWVTRGGDIRLYLLIGWSIVVFWLVFWSELRIGKRSPEPGPRGFFAGRATLVGEERPEPDGRRRRGWMGTANGTMEFNPEGILWEPKSAQGGPDEIRIRWEQVYAWRVNAVLPLVWRASAYLTLTTDNGSELTFHINGLRRWRKVLREAVIVGPALDREPEPEPAPAASSPVIPVTLISPAVMSPPEEPAEPQMPEAQPEEAVEPQPEPPRAPVEAEAPEETVAATPEAGEDRYEAVIGLECHVELSTDSKVFCGCPTRFGADPNTQVCPVCTGQPGALPVLNERAVEYALRIAIALGCQIAPESIFHRKNYFYPDMPKNFQISQYDIPLATAGHLEFEVDGERRRAGIHRVHLEEDTGKTFHVGTTGRIAEAEYAKVDYNRAGVPLVEIVSEPDIRSPEDARAFLAELRTLLQGIGVSDVRMEEGSLRCDANVSVRRAGEGFGIKAEVKNMNSMRSVQRALAYEIDRQLDLVRAGETVVQETRHFDENTGTTSSLRTKEYAFDYRYFPEPDLVPLAPEDAWIEQVRGRLPELPAERRGRFVDAYGLTPVDARTLSSTPDLADAFEVGVQTYGGDAKRIARWYLGELASLANERGVEPHEAGVSPEQVAELQKLIDSGRVSDSAAKTTVLKGVVEEGKSPATVVEEGGLAQISDESELVTIVDEVIAGHPDVVEQIRGGKTGAVNRLMGQVMKQTRGRANPEVVGRLLNERLGL